MEKIPLPGPASSTSWKQCPTGSHLEQNSCLSTAIGVDLVRQAKRKPPRCDSVRFRSSGEFRHESEADWMLESSTLHQPNIVYLLPRPHRCRETPTSTRFSSTPSHLNQGCNLEAQKQPGCLPSAHAAQGWYQEEELGFDPDPEGERPCL